MACKSAAWQELRFNDGSDRKASGSTLAEALLLVASSDKMLWDDYLSLLGQSYEQQITMTK